MEKRSASTELRETLAVYREQLTDRISDLETLKTHPQPVQGAIVASRGAERTPFEAHQKGDTSLNTYTADLISAAFIRHLNVDIAALPEQKAYKIPLVDREKIAQLEHTLQLMAMGSNGGASGATDLKTRNECLTQLNALYYTELKSCQECLGDIISVIKEDAMEGGVKDVAGIPSSAREAQSAAISALQRRVNHLEREKSHMESQIVRLKERWNGLVEAARKRQEQGAAPDRSQ